MKKLKIAGWCGIGIIVIYLLFGFIGGCQEQARKERANEASVYRPPNVVSGTLIAMPDRWTRVPLMECVGFVLTPTNPTDRFVELVDGDPNIRGPFTAYTRPMDGPIAGVQVRSYEEHPIEMAYSMVK